MMNVSDRLPSLLDAVEGVTLTAHERAALTTVADRLDADAVAGLAALLSRLVRDEREQRRLLFELPETTGRVQARTEHAHRKVAALEAERQADRAHLVDLYRALGLGEDADADEAVEMAGRLFDEHLVAVEAGDALVKLSNEQADTFHDRSCACGDRAEHEAEDGSDWSLIEPDAYRAMFGEAEDVEPVEAGEAR